jgi:hypothetical protein
MSGRITWGNAVHFIILHHDVIGMLKSVPKASKSLKFKKFIESWFPFYFFIRLAKWFLVNKDNGQCYVVVTTYDVSLAQEVAEILCILLNLKITCDKAAGCW